MSVSVKPMVYLPGSRPSVCTARDRRPSGSSWTPPDPPPTDTPLASYRVALYPSTGAGEVVSTTTVKLTPQAFSSSLCFQTGLFSAADVATGGTVSGTRV